MNDFGRFLEEHGEQESLADDSPVLIRLEVLHCYHTDSPSLPRVNLIVILLMAR